MPPVADYVRESLSLLFITGGPVIVTLAIVGLVIGILQAATQVNDPAIGFLPRAIILGALVMTFGGWFVNSYATFLVKVAERMASSAP
jgi:flagellar biosynthesis protein FliQ